MTRRKSNNVVRHSGGIGSGVASGPSAFTASFHSPQSLGNGATEEAGANEAAPGLDESRADSSNPPRQLETERMSIPVTEEKPDANLVMDLSSREEGENQEIQKNGIGNVASGGVSGEGAGNDEMDMDDAGIYGDMAEGDMVAAMLEEAQIPRSQFLGLNAEEKQKLLEARRTCKFCGKVCIKRSDLQRHLLVHTGERPWLCKVSRESDFDRIIRLSTMSLIRNKLCLQLWLLLFTVMQQKLQGEAFASLSSTVGPWFGNQRRQWRIRGQNADAAAGMEGSADSS